MKSVPHLHHLGVDVEAGVAQLGDLLGQELHPLGGVAEDDGLVYLELWGQKYTYQRLRRRKNKLQGHKSVSYGAKQQLDDTIKPKGLFLLW